MKQIIQNNIAIIGKTLVLLLLFFSATAFAAPKPTGGTPDFNHMTTGYPLTGAHAVAVCETCHIGGVFKGTPRDCDGCHAVGRRVVATPKHTAHIVTSAACDTCHFNTVTFLGARFNHGMAQPGQCTTCHNGRQSQARAPGHTGLKATETCDKCHRTYAWVPATWNHTTTAPGSCENSGCHLAGQNQYYKPTNHSQRIGMNTYNCEDCHGFVSWVPARYKHNGVSPNGRCDGCHNDTIAAGKNGGHLATTDDCGVCHNRTSWSGALGGKPANHIPEGSAPSCGTCHTGTTVVRGSTLHAYLSGMACTTCHLKNNPYSGNGQDTKSIGHEGMKSGDDCSKSGCHKPLGNKGTAYTNWD